MNNFLMRTLVLSVIVGVSAASAGCSDGTQSASAEEVALVSVTPRGGSMSVDPNARIELEFDNRMADGMEQFCAVHIGELDGSEVGGRWEWSEDRHKLTFTPDQPLRASMRHTLHVGGGLTDADGHRMNFEQHGFDIGGEWADEAMFGPAGMMGGHPHMGQGWEHYNGSYGMAFPFWTAPDSSAKVALLRVSPQGGSTGVDPNTRIELEFDHPMEDGAEELCSVHLGGLDGQEVTGAWEWSEDHHLLTFAPDQPLEPGMEHTLHVGGGLTDVDGHEMDFDQHGFDMGGRWVDEDMFGPGMMGGHSHVGDGWQHHNGTYGMAFPFSTAP